MSVFETVFVGLVIAFVGAVFQYRSWRHTHFQSLRDRERIEALALISKLSTAVDTRLTAQSRYLSLTLRGEVLADDREDVRHREAIDVWMGQFSSFKSQIKHVFGDDAMKEFEYEVHEYMRRVSELAAVKNRRGFDKLSSDQKPKYLAIRKEADLSRHYAYTLLHKLNDMVRDGLIGRSKFINDIYSNDPSLVTRTYLIRRLFNMLDDTASQ